MKRLQTYLVLKLAKKKEFRSSNRNSSAKVKNITIIEPSHVSLGIKNRARG
jgi:hypothetical protein